MFLIASLTIWLIIFLIAAIVTPDQIVLVLLPFLTWAGGMAANWVKSKLGTQGFMGFTFISLVLPAAALIISIIMQTLALPNLSFINIFLLSLASVFVNQFIKQLTQTLQGTQDPVVPNISTVKKENKL